MNDGRSVIVGPIVPESAALDVENSADCAVRDGSKRPLVRVQGTAFDPDARETRRPAPRAEADGPLGAGADIAEPLQDVAEDARVAAMDEEQKAHSDKALPPGWRARPPPAEDARAETRDRAVSIVDERAQRGHERVGPVLVRVVTTAWKERQPDALEGQPQHIRVRVRDDGVVVDPENRDRWERRDLVRSRKEAFPTRVYVRDSG
jgi:hypothetical protein